MLEKNELSNNWVDTLIALSNLVICELSPDLSPDSDNMNICQYVLFFCYIIILKCVHLISC